MFDTQVLKIAHRGASGYAPENSVAAFSKAIELGADMIEFDVRRTSDGELVVFHDSRLRRLAGVWEKIRNMSYEELSNYEINGEAIPRLADIFRLCRGACQLNVEVKQRGLSEEISGLIRDYGMEKDVLISSFLHNELAKFKAIDKNLRIALLIKSHFGSTLTLVKLAKHLDAEAIHMPFGTLNRLRLKTIKNHGLKVNVWTVDDPAEIEWLKKLGVDGIVSNFPDRI